MYRRGIADAERGDPHPFYYQHYYHYRRGYDRVRRGSMLQRLARGVMWLGLGLGLLVLASFGTRYVLQAREPATTTAPVADIVETPTPQPLFPTPTLLPPTEEIAPSPVVLHVDGFAVVSNTAGKVLRGRQEPRLSAKVQASFQEGERVRILEGPVEADGYRWWRIEGSNGNGWSAEQSQEGLVWLQVATE